MKLREIFTLLLFTIWTLGYIAISSVSIESDTCKDKIETQKIIILDTND